MSVRAEIEHLTLSLLVIELYMLGIVFSFTPLHSREKNAGWTMAEREMCSTGVESND